MLFECLSWLLATLINISISLKYLLVQSYFIFLSLVGRLYMKRILLLGVLFKLGVPPFHLWYVVLSFFLRKRVFVLFSTLHKIVPILFLSFILISKNWIVFLMLRLSRVIIISVRGLFYVLLASSVVNTNWALMASLLAKSLFIVYWGVYRMFTVFFFRVLVIDILTRLINEQPRLLGVIWLVVAGVPPFVIFWLKACIFIQVLKVSLSLRLLLIITRVLAMVAYFRAFHLSLSLPTRQKQVLFPFVLSISLLLSF